LCFCGKTSEFVIGCGEEATLLTVKVPAAVEFSSFTQRAKRPAKLQKSLMRAQLPRSVAVPK
ncbi:MAG: hypothetical protein WBE14_28640, partial [Xanthobacteraceae bacterium]